MAKRITRAANLLDCVAREPGFPGEPGSSPCRDYAPDHAKVQATAGAWDDIWRAKGLEHAREGRPATLHHYRGSAARSYAEGYLAGLEEDQLLLERLQAGRAVQGN